MKVIAKSGQEIWALYAQLSQGRLVSTALRVKFSKQNKSRRISKLCLSLYEGVGTRYTFSREQFLSVFSVTKNCNH